MLLGIYKFKKRIIIPFLVFKITQRINFTYDKINKINNLLKDIKMNSNQIKCFISLGKTLNFTETAKELFLSQSTVSKNIQNLEKEIGISLIQHQHRHINLTPEGKYFLAQITDIDAKLTRVLQNMQQSSKSENVKVNIGYTGLPFERSFLPTFCRLVKDKIWNINLVKVSLSKDENVHDQLIKNKIDFMIYQSDYFDDKPDLGFLPFFKGTFSVVISKNNPLSSKSNITLKDLKEQKIYLWIPKNSLPSINMLKTQIRKKLPNVNLTVVTGVSTIEMYAEAQDGLGIVPSFAYNRSNNNVNYKFLNWDYPVNFGVGYSLHKCKEPYFREICLALKHSAILEKREW